jgi:hypothetical protein
MHWERPHRAISGPTFLTRDKSSFVYPDPNRQPFIPGGPAGAWDYGNLDTVSTGPIRSGDRLLFYYGGRRFDHSGRTPDGRAGKGKDGGVGLATLRLDGFVSVDGDAGGGTVITRPLRIDEGELFVNAAAKGGEIRIAVLDAAKDPVPGFGPGDFRAIRSDRVRTHCRWRRKVLSSMAGRRVRLQFFLRNASLYAFWIEPPARGE